MKFKRLLNEAVWDRETNLNNHYLKHALNVVDRDAPPNVRKDSAEELMHEYESDFRLATKRFKEYSEKLSDSPCENIDVETTIERGKVYGFKMMDKKKRLRDVKAKLSDTTMGYLDVVVYNHFDNAIVSFYRVEQGRFMNEFVANKKGDLDENKNKKSSKSTEDEKTEKETDTETKSEND